MSAKMKSGLCAMQLMIGRDLIKIQDLKTLLCVSVCVCVSRNNIKRIVQWVAVSGGSGIEGI